MLSDGGGLVPIRVQKYDCGRHLDVIPSFGIFVTARSTHLQLTIPDTLLATLLEEGQTARGHHGRNSRVNLNSQQHENPP